MNLNLSQTTLSRSLKIYAGAGSLYFLCSSFCSVRKHRKINNCNLKAILKILGFNIFKSIIWPASLICDTCKCVAVNKPCSSSCKLKLNDGGFVNNGSTIDENNNRNLNHYSFDGDSDSGSGSGSDSRSGSGSGSDSELTSKHYSDY